MNIYQKKYIRNWLIAISIIAFAILNGWALITGVVAVKILWMGVLVALGSSGMAQSISSSGTQGVLACNFSTQSGGKSFLVSDSDGNAIVSFTPSKAYECAVVTAPKIKSNGSYTIVVGAAVSGADENGFAQNTSYSGGTELGYSSISAGGFSGMPGGIGGGMDGMGGGMGDMPDNRRGGGRMR